MARRPVIPEELTRGPFTLEDARRAGLSRRQLQGRAWRRLGHGLYCSVRWRESPLQLLNLIARELPPIAVFSGRTAAWLLGLGLEPCDPVEVTVPKGWGVSARSGLSVRRAGVEWQEVVMEHGLRCTAAVRTVTDLARRAPLVEGVTAVEAGLRVRAVSRAQLEAFVYARLGRPGVNLLGRAVDLAEPLSESPMETRLRILLIEGGLGRPLVQAPLFDARGASLGRADLYYPERRLIIEYDGRTHRDSVEEDNRRQNALFVAGYHMLRLTATDVYRTPAATVEQVCRILLEAA